jgi:hypothetical protein
MCGIGGIRRYGDKPISESMVRLLLTGLEPRGNDAAGIAVQQQNGDVYLLKQDTTPWNLTASASYKEWINEHLTDETIAVMVHARAATKGNPRFEKNNHPLFDGITMLVHNGKIDNDEKEFDRLKLKRAADTDTDILRAICDDKGITPAAIDAMCGVRGTAAVMAFSAWYPGLFMVGRSGSPLSIGINGDNHLVIASTKHVVHRAMRPLFMKYGIPFRQQTMDAGFSPFPDHTMWILGEKGLEHHGEFKPFWGTYHEPVRRVYINYKERQAEFTRKASIDTKEFVKNPGGTAMGNKDGDQTTTQVLLDCPKCKKPLILGKNQIGKDLAKLTCPADKGGCGASLAGAKLN